MGVSDGQLANENNFNAAFMARNTDTDTTGKIDLKNADSAQILDVQAVINSILEGKLTSTVNAGTGADLAVAAPTTPVLVFTGAVTSIRSIAAPSTFMQLICINRSGGTLTVKSNDAAVIDIYIPTGDMQVPNGGVFMLVYDTTTSGRWRLVSGGGGGALASGVTTLADGDTSKAVTFAAALATASYMIAISFKNTATADASQVFFNHKVKAQDANGFTILLNQAVIGGSDSFEWAVFRI